MKHIRPVFLKLAFTASMLLWASIAVTPAMAALITYSFAGDIDKVQGKSLQSRFSLTSNPVMTGSLTVNTTDLNSNPHNGLYTIVPGSFSLNVQGYTVTGGSLGLIGIHDGPTAGKDSADVAVGGPFVALPVGKLGLHPFLFDVKLVGPGNLWNTDALPTTSPSISSFTKANEWRLVFGPGGRVLSGAFTAITAVPLPAAVILFGAGLIALVGLGAGSWRKRNNSLA